MSISQGDDAFDEIIANIDKEPIIKTFVFRIDDEGWLPRGEYLVISTGNQARIAYRASSGESWSPPHYTSAQ